MITRISRRPGFASGATVTSAKTSSVWERTAGLRSSSANLLWIRSISFCLATSFSDLGRTWPLALPACMHLLRLASRWLPLIGRCGLSAGPMGAGNSNQAILAAIASLSVVSFFCNSLQLLAEQRDFLIAHDPVVIDQPNGNPFPAHDQIGSMEEPLSTQPDREGGALLAAGGIDVTDVLALRPG